MQRPLIFVSCGAPVVPLLAGLATRYVLVVPDGGIAEQLRAGGIDAVPWQQFTDPARVAAIRERAPRLPDALLARLDAADVGWGFAGRGRGEACRNAIREVLERTLATQLLVGEIGRSLAATGRLAAVVLHEDVTPPARALLAATRDAGVPSLHLPHGVYARERLVGADVHGTLHADVVAVGGCMQREWFLSRGVAADRIVVTGNPAWDRLCMLSRHDAPPIGLPPGPVVTVAASWIGADSAHRQHVEALHDAMMAAALDGVARLRATVPSLRLVLRPHPSAPASSDASLMTRAAAAGAVPDRIERGDGVALLARSDALVTLPSTLAIEAILLGTPVVAPGFAYDGDAVRSADRDGASVAAALEASLGDVGSSAFALRCATFATRYNGPSDGGAGERVLALIDALAARAVRPGPVDALAPARALAAGGHWDEVVAALQDDVRPDALALCAEALARLGRPTEAEPCFRRAVAAGAGAEARAGLGLLLLERGAHAEAEAVLAQAADIDPSSDLAWCGLGVLAALRGDRDGAVPLLRRALAINPANPDARGALDALAG
ncbi:MAG TPA: tetratricopeptide repeat protein [Candidatus Binatia bacterium]|nr:tetratricopeptide repeat protein [Candidatus Binatia bacterium]